MNKRYWLRGSVVSLIIGVILIAFYKIGLLPVALLFWGLQVPYPGSELNELIILVIISVVFYFIVGAVLGWLYGKIKNRKSLASPLS